MKKPFLNQFERLLVYCNTMAGSGLMIRFAWMRLLRDLGRNRQVKWLYKVLGFGMVFLAIFIAACHKEAVSPGGNALPATTYCITDSVYSSPYNEQLQVVIKPIEGGVIAEIHEGGVVKRLYCYPKQPK